MIYNLVKKPNLKIRTPKGMLKFLKEYCTECLEIFTAYVLYQWLEAIAYRPSLISTNKKIL